ncbi:MAG TPA: hypothetical protein VJC11_02030, partial [Patescibacteria group bacterium]|nr:hypothetical protein [Patescibacteria group bacterium]
MRKFTLKKLFAKGMRVFVAILTVTALSFPNGFVLTSFAGNVTVSGKVFRPDGVTPAANVWVQLHTPDWATFNSGSSTNEIGEYMISGPEGSSIPARDYVLEVQVPFSNPDGFLAPAPAPVVVGTTSLTGQNFVFKNATKTLTGKVIRKTGTGVEGAMVNANRMGGAPMWANAQTNATGEFTLKIAGGNWMVNVNPNMGPDSPAVDWVYFEQPQQVTFNDNEEAESKSITLTVTTASGTINGSVKSSAGTVFTQGSVDARSSDGRGAWGQIKPDGTFSLRVPAGGYDIFAHIGGMESEGKYSIPSTHVDIADGQTLTVDIVAKERLGKITGQITDKSGVPVKKVMVNANRDNGQGQGPGEFSNAMSDDAGNFTLSASAGRWHLNVNQGPDSPPYAYDGQPIDVIVPGDDAVVSGVNIQLTFVDAKISGRVVNEAGEVINNFPGYAFARPTAVVPGAPFREYGAPVMNGQFTIQLPSSVATTVTIGIHTPPESDYASAADQTVLVVANSTVTKDITLIKNNARVHGRVLDASGFPLSSCNFRGDVFLNSFKGDWRGSQIKPDCTFSISTTPGTYQFGYNFDGSAGFMNRPPAPDPIEVNSGDSIERNIKVVSGDATITGKVLDPDGKPVPNVFIFADNHEEIDQFRNEAGDGPRGPGGLKPGEKEDGPKGIERNGPGGAKNPQEIFNFCKDPKNATECKNFKLPEGSKGPGGCSNALECTNYCKTHQSECLGQEATMKPPTGGQPGEFSGPGGCKTEVECKAFCSKPENFDACHQFGPPPGEQMPQGTGESKFSSSKGPDDVFDKMINSGSQSDAQGNFTIKVLSGHIYSVGAGLPPESKFLPAKFQKADLTNSKSVFITMQLRTADAKLSGVVLKDGKAVQQGFVHAWAEDGGFSGSPIMNGGYSLNLTKGTVWHVGADSPSGRDLYRSPEITVVVETQKDIKKNFILGKTTFVVPPPMSVTFDSTETKVITLEDGTTVTIPSGAIDDSGSVTVTANPTVDIQSSRTAKPVGVGYKLEATDSDGRAVTKFNSNVTVKFSYSDKQLEEAGLGEEALVPSFYDSSSNSWNRVTNATQDTDNN